MVTVAPPPPGTYRLDPDRSTVRFTTTHVFGLGKVTGTFNLSAGKVVVTAPATASTLSVTASAASFASGSTGRDKTVKSATYLDAEHHPDIVFDSTGARITEAGWVVEGTLTVRGHRAPAEVTVTAAEVAGTTLTVSATARIDRYAHGVTAMKGMTGRHLDLAITAYADRT
jgi:polyisoprenoid-binding protein YceI